VGDARSRGRLATEPEGGGWPGYAALGCPVLSIRRHQRGPRPERDRAKRVAFGASGRREAPDQFGRSGIRGKHSVAGGVRATDPHCARGGASREGERGGASAVARVRECVCCLLGGLLCLVGGLLRGVVGSVHAWSPPSSPSPRSPQERGGGPAPGSSAEGEDAGILAGSQLVVIGRKRGRALMVGAREAAPRAAGRWCATCGLGMVLAAGAGRRARRRAEVLERCPAGCGESHSWESVEVVGDARVAAALRGEDPSLVEVEELEGDRPAVAELAAGPPVIVSPPARVRRRRWVAPGEDLGAAEADEAIRRDRD
jgi:hypothetical protein